MADWDQFSKILSILVGPVIKFLTFQTCLNLQFVGFEFARMHAFELKNVACPRIRDKKFRFSAGQV